MTDELMALLAKATADDFEKARGAPAPDSIWLIYGGGGETWWHTVADPEGNDEPSVPYVRADKVEALITELPALIAEVERLREALVSEREENLWKAYDSGHVKDGQWTHMFMSDGEWLAVECGFNPRDGYYDDAAIKAAIPNAARAALAGQP